MKEQVLQDRFDQHHTITRDVRDSQQVNHQIDHSWAKFRTTIENRYEWVDISPVMNVT